MQINGAELNLITSCLRLAAMLYETTAKEKALAFKATEAAQDAAYSRACGELAAKLAKGG